MDNILFSGLTIEVIGMPAILELGLLALRPRPRFQCPSSTSGMDHATQLNTYIGALLVSLIAVGPLLKSR